MNNTLVTNYDHFDYNNEFIPITNIFNTVGDTRKIGIGTSYPEFSMDVRHSIDVKNNINITNNLYFTGNNTYNNNFTYILYKNKNTNIIDLGKLIYSSPNSKYLDYKWYRTEDSLFINTNDNRPNSQLEYKSNHYNFIDINNTYSIDLINNLITHIKYIYIYDTTNNNPITDLDNLKINNIDTSYKNGIYQLNTPIILLPNIKKTMEISSSPPNSSTTKIIQFIGHYDYDAGSYWFNYSYTGAYINRDISIWSNNNYNKQFYIDGNCFIKQNLNSININCNTFKNNSIFETNTLNTKQINFNTNTIIYSNSISFGKYNNNTINNNNNTINNNNNTINNNNNNNNNTICTIGDFTYINKNGDLYASTLSLKNNVNNISQIYHNNTKTFIQIDNNINLGGKFYSKTQIQANDFSLEPTDAQTLLLISNTYVNTYTKSIVSPTFITNTNITSTYDKLTIFGDTTIEGQLQSTNLNYTDFIFTPENSVLFDTVYIKGLSHLGHHTKTNKIITHTMDTARVKFKHSSYSNHTGSIFFDKTTKRLYGKTNSLVSPFAYNSKINNNNNVNNLINNNGDVKIISSLNIQNITVPHIYSLYLDNQTANIQTLQLPLYNIMPRNYKHNSKIGSLRFNKEISTYEAHSGSEWNPLLFETLTDITKKYKFEKKTPLILLEDQTKIIIPQNFYYNLNIGSMTPISGETYILSQIHYSINDIYLLNNNKLEINGDDYIVHNAVDNGNNFSATLTKKSDLTYDNYMHFTEDNSGIIETTNHNKAYTLISDYLDNKYFHILKNILYIENNVNTGIVIKHKKIVGNNTYGSYIVDNSFVMYISSTTSGVTHNSITSDPTIQINLTSDEEVIDFNESLIIKHNCTLSQFTKISPILYTSTLNPISINTFCTIKIPNNAFTHIYGGPNIQSVFNWTSDRLTPSITSISISNDNSTITVTFNEIIYNTNSGSGSIEAYNFELSLPPGLVRIQVTSISPTTGNTNEYILGINVSGTPDGSESLTVNPVLNSIYDLAGNVAITSQSNNIVNLNDKRVPLISTYNPTHSSTSIEINSNIILTFDNNIFANTGNIVLTPQASNAINIDINDSQITISGNTLTINPTTDLLEGVLYTITIGSTVIKNQANNYFTGISGTTYQFTSKLVLPIDWGLSNDGSSITSGDEWIIGANGDSTSGWSSYETPDDTWQLFEHKLHGPSYLLPGIDYYTLNRIYERGDTDGGDTDGIKLKFNHNNHGETTIDKPWAAITKYGYHNYDSTPPITNVNTRLFNEGDIIFDFNKYMVITSFDWINYPPPGSVTLGVKLYYWDHDLDIWVIIFDGESVKIDIDGNPYYYTSLSFRSTSINDDPITFPVGTYASGDPKISLHYEAPYNNMTDNTADISRVSFVRQTKWAYKYKLTMTKEDGNWSNYTIMNGMQMKAKILPGSLW